jgi:hypothetical protein
MVVTSARVLEVSANSGAKIAAIAKTPAAKKAPRDAIRFGWFFSASEVFD